MSGGRDHRRQKRGAREVALDVLRRVAEEQAFSPLALQAELAAAGLQDVDRGLATELVYGTLQWQGWLDAQLEPLLAKGIGKLQVWVLILLRISLYQFTRLDRIPQHAVVNEAVTIAKQRGHEGIAKLINGVLRSWLRQKESAEASAEHAAADPVRYAQPEWMYRRWMRQWGEAAAMEMAGAILGRSQSTVRVQTNRISPDELIAALTAEGYTVERSPLSADGLRIAGGKPVQFSRWFIEGLLTIQDDSSMVVADAVSPRPGMMILDACAAPGGKTTHLAQRLNGQGTVWAMDQHEHKQSLIIDNARRLGLEAVVRTKIMDAAEASSVFDKEMFDAILLDAPCSGSGVFKRKPERKWHPEKEARKTLQELIGIQHRLIRALAPLVKPGGVFVYSTCSVDREENDQQVQQFLAEHPMFTLDTSLPELLNSQDASADWRKRAFARDLPAGMLQLLPQDADSDGFFIARMRRL